MTSPAPTPSHGHPAGVLPAGPPGWRAFGTEPADVEIDFGRPDPPAVVTDILVACARTSAEAATTPAADAALRHQVWSWPVSHRIACLLRIATATDPSRSFTVTARCRRHGCGQVFEAELGLPALLELDPGASADTTLVCTPGTGRSVTVRRPTGRDQATWRATRYATTQQAIETMARSLLVTAAAPDGQTAPAGATSELPLAAIEAALTEGDELAAFRITCACPHCGASQELPVDLQQLGLDRLRARQTALLRQVHQLADRYGWSESEILRLPVWRRQQYLELAAAKVQP